MKGSKSKVFAEVVREHHAGLRYFIRSLGIHSDWVDDVAQEAFIIAYRKWADLDAVENAGLWLRAIARNIVMNEFAKANRRQRLMDENITTLLLQADGMEAAGGKLGDEELRHQALRQCMTHLTERSRKVVDERYFRDQNATEIGKKLSISSTAVRKILFHARQLLAECLAGKEIGIDPNRPLT